MSQKLKFEIMNLTRHLQGVGVCVCRGEGVESKIYAMWVAGIRILSGTLHCD